MEYRNASPPPEIFDNQSSPNDCIRNTVYSKIHLIELLKRILNKIINYCSAQSDNFEDDLDFDDDLCEFMDMTVEKEVLEFVQDFIYVEPFCDAICMQKSDRLNELFIGILSNFASNEFLCDKMTTNQDILNLLLSLWSSHNSAFLLECNRLLKLVLKTSNQSSKWLSSIEENKDFLPNIIFILQSSLNNELLISTVQLIGQLMKLDDELCEKWISNELLSALLVARNEAQWSVEHDIDYFHYVIHLFSTNENGVVCLISNFSWLYQGFTKYFSEITDEEPHLILVEQYHNSLRLILPTVDVVISNITPDEALDLLQTEPSMLEHLVRLIYACNFHSDNSMVQQVFIEISSFLNTVINITHCVVMDQSFTDHTKIKWIQSIDVGCCLPQLQAFLECSTHNEQTRDKIIQIAQKLQLSYVQEALIDLKLKQHTSDIL